MFIKHNILKVFRNTRYIYIYIYILHYVSTIACSLLKCKLYTQNIVCHDNVKIICNMFAVLLTSGEHITSKKDSRSSK